MCIPRFGSGTNPWSHSRCRSRKPGLLQQRWRSCAAWRRGCCKRRTSRTPPCCPAFYIEPLVGTVWLAVRKRGGHPCFVADCVYIYIYTHIYNRHL